MDADRRDLERRARQGDTSAALALRLRLTREEPTAEQARRLMAFVEEAVIPRTPERRAEFLWSVAQVTAHTLPGNLAWKRRARTYAGSLAYSGHAVALVVHVEGLVVLGFRSSPIEALGVHKRWPAMGCSPEWFSEAWPELGHRKPARAAERHDRLSAWAFSVMPDRIMVREEVAFGWAQGLLDAAREARAARMREDTIRLHTDRATYRAPVGPERIMVGSLVSVGPDGLLRAARPEDQGLVLGVAVRSHEAEGTVDVSMGDRTVRLDLGSRVWSPDLPPPEIAMRHPGDGRVTIWPDPAPRGVPAFNSTNQGEGTIARFTFPRNPEPPPPPAPAP